MFQLFEKLKLQSPAGSQPTAKPDEGETVRSHLPVHDPGRREQSSTEAGLSHGLGTKYKDSPKAREENNATKPGKCHTRHINQLFIRGENVILVNPQRLWYLLDSSVFFFKETHCSTPANKSQLFFIHTPVITVKSDCYIILIWRFFSTPDILAL